jgi:hypothetical protein
MRPASSVATSFSARSLACTDIGRGEHARAGLLTPSQWRPHNVAGDADDTVLLTEQVKCLDGFFGRQIIRPGGNMGS